MVVLCWPGLFSQISQLLKIDGKSSAYWDGAQFNFHRYALPDVPKGWQPDPRRVWDADKNKENIQIPSLPPRPGKWKSEISAEQVRFMARLTNNCPKPDYI